MNLFSQNVGIASLVMGFLLGMAVNTFTMWVAASYILNIPGIRFRACLKAVVALSVVLAIMAAVSPFFGKFPIYGMIVWLIVTIFLLNLTIEGTLDVPSGGFTILIIYMIVNVAMLYMVIRFAS